MQGPHFHSRGLPSSVQFSLSVVSDSLRPHGLQHVRPPCPSPAPGVYSNSCSSNRLILCPSLLVPPSIFLSFRSLQMSQLFISGGQSIGVSVSTSVLPMKIQGSFPLGWIGWISSHDSSPTPHFKSISSSVLRFLYGPTFTFIHNYCKNHSFDYMDKKRGNLL